MAQIPYRANLSAATFPMVLSKGARTVINPGSDQNFDRRIDPSGDTVVSKASAGIPQALFMQDIIPTVEGFQSIVYQPNSPNNPALGGSSINAAFKMSVQTSAGVKQLVRFVCLANATVQSSIGGITSWAAVTVPGSWTAPADESVIHWGMVQGVAYILRSDIGKFYSVIGSGPVVFADVTGTITGTAGGISMCSSYNYMVTASFDTIIWSSLTNPLDFVASNISGAGSEKPAGNETTIRFLLPHPSGFFIYTRNNVIAAKYTGNRAYPWRFIPIPDSGDMQAKPYIGWNAESMSHFGPTASGVIHQITPDAATIILTDVSEYLEKEPYYDSFNPATNVFTRVAKNPAVSNPALCRIVCDKYLYISHIQPASLGVPYKHILVYDIGTKRMGKLVIDHSYIDEQDNVPIIANFGVSGVSPLNTFFKVLYNINTQVVGTYVAAGVLLLGKFAYSRDKTICIEGFDLQSVQSDEFIAAVDRQFSVLLLCSMDGVNFDTIYAPTLKAITKVAASYNSHSPETLEVCMLIKGAFNIQSLSMLCTVGGKP